MKVAESQRNDERESMTGGLEDERIGGLEREGGRRAIMDGR